MICLRIAVGALTSAAAVERDPSRRDFCRRAPETRDAVALHDIALCYVYICT